MIQSFKDVDTRVLFTERKHRRFVNIISVALRKLDQLEAAATLQDLQVPPGNRLEALRGDAEGRHSIRINDQFRVRFAWRDNGPHDVEIVDYH